ncbi:unnamed protein product [Clavelina lepadiformis]|uniref:Uncharacterized protein n=1 Tax=Clavelina lepadiformis TaxID=159417 RepID=A0ABP0F1H7_CLALP
MAHLKVMERKLKFIFVIVMVIELDVNFYTFRDSVLGPVLDCYYMYTMFSMLRKDGMVTTGDVVQDLAKETKISPIDCDLQKENVVNAEGSLFEKIQYELDRIRTKNDKIKFLRFNYAYSYDVTNLTGKQFLQLLVKILNDDWKIGEGILLSADEKYQVAILKYSATQLAIKTYPIPGDEPCNRGIFSKLFDDNYVQLTQNSKEEFKDYYAPDKIKLLRKNSREKFPIFLEQKMTQNFINLQPYNYPFIGLLFEIARTDITTDAYLEARGILNNVPVAACVKLAMDTQQTGKLKKVFGERIQLIKYTKRDTVVRQKADLRMVAAKEIILQ